MRLGIVRAFQSRKEVKVYSKNTQNKMREAPYNDSLLALLFGLVGCLGAYLWGR
jgi:hypothetical protein